jgi:hypothetical protein
MWLLAVPGLIYLLGLRAEKARVAWKARARVIIMNRVQFENLLETGEIPT